MAETISIIINGVDNASGPLGRVSDSLKSMGSSLTSMGGSLTAATAPLAILGAVGIKTAADFEASMNVLTVAARSSGETMEDLSSAALAVGGDVTLVGISASQAGDSMTEMYKAGLTTNQIFGDMQGYLEGTVPLTGALRAAIDLAAASELDLAAATSVVGVTMNQFGLDASEASNIANVLVQTADAGVASVSGLGDALGNVGPIAAGMGQSLEDTTLALGLMAQAGITGSEAGTNLKSMLLNLSKQTPETTGTLKALGVSLYDATGAMLPLPNILGQLEAGMAGMTDEQRNATMATLAGSYGLNSMRVLLAEGTVGWNEMEAAVASAATVQESAAARTQGFNAAIETMKGVIETLMITALTPLIQNHLTPLIQKFSDVIAKVMEVDPSLIMLAVTIGAIAVAAGPVLMMLGVMVTALGALLSPIGLVVLAVAGLGLAWGTNFLGIRDAVQPVIDIIATFAETIIWAIEDGWGLVEWAEVVATKFPFLGAAFVAVAETIDSAMVDINLIVSQVLSIITGIIEEHGPRVREIFETTWNRINEIVASVTGSISSIVTTIFGAIQWFLATHGEEIKAFLGGAWERIGTIIDGVVQIIQQTVVPVFQAVATFLSEHSAEIRTVLEIAWTAIKTAIDVALTFIEGIIKAVLLVIKGDWSGAWETLKETAEKIWDKIKNAIRIIAEKIGPILADIWDEIKKKAAEKWEGVKDAIVERVEETREAIETWAKAIPKNIETWWSSLKQKVATIWENVKQAIAEKIAEALESILSWLDDTLYAIENFDLKAAAAHFFGTVLPGIAAKIGEALTDVGNWLKETFTKIKNYDLKGASTTFFQTALAGIAVKITEALTNVGIWLKDVFTKISSYDLKGAAITTFQTVVAGIIEKAVNILAQVETFLKDILYKITNYDFKSATLTSLQTIIAGIIEKAIEILQNVQIFLDDIRTKISEFSLWDAGVALIQGLIDGIGSMVGTLVSAAEGVVNSAIQAAKNLLGIGSPSKVFRAIGANTMLGMVIGIEELAGAVVSAMQGALGDVTVEAAEQAAKIADAVSTIIEAMLALIDAAAAMMAFQVPDGLTAAVDEIVEQMEYVIEAFVAAAENFEEKGLAAATAFAEAAGTIGENISAAVEGIMALLEYSGGLGLFAVVQFLRDMMLVVRTFETAASHFASDGLTAAAAFAEAVGTIGGNISAAVEGIKALLEYTGGLGLYAVVQFLRDMMLVVRTFETAATHFAAEGLAEATAFAEAAGTIGGNVSAAVEGIKALLEYSGGLGVYAIVQFLRDMMLVVRTFETAASHFTADALVAATAFAEAAGTIGGNISAAVEGIMALMEYSGQIGVTAMSDFLHAVQQMVGSLAKGSSVFDADASASATAFAEAAGTIGGNISAAVEGIKVLMEYSGQIGVTAISDFLYAVEQMVGSLAKASSVFDADALAAATAFAEAAGAIGGNISAAVEGIKLLMEYAGGLAVSTVVQFLQDMALMVRTFETGAAWFTAEGLAAATAFAEAAGAIGGNVSAAVEGIGALLEYTGGLGLYAIVQFFNDVGLMVRTFETAAASFSAEGLAAATAFAQAAGTIGGSVKNAVEGIGALLEYTGGLGLYAVVLFLNDMSLMVRTFENAADSFTAEGLAAAAAFASAAGTIGGSVKNAIEGIKLLLEYTGGLGVYGMVLFLQDVALMVRTFENAADSFTSEGLAAATAFAQAAGTVGGSVKNAVEGIKLLLEYTGGLGLYALVQFFNDVGLMVRTFETAAADFTAEGLAAATAFASAAGTVGGSIKNAIEGIKLLMEYSGGLAISAVDAFVADMKLVVEKIEEAAAGFSAEGLAAAAAFAEAAGTIGGNIKNAIEGIKLLMEFSGQIGQDALDAFLAAVRKMIETLEEASRGFDEDMLKAATAFAAAAGTVGGQIKNAIEGIQLLMKFSGALGEEAIAAFLVAINQMVKLMFDAARGFSEDMLKAAVAFAVAVGTVGGVIKTALEAIAGLIKQTGVLSVAAMDQFLANVRTMISKLAEANRELGTIGIDEAEAFLAKIKEILQAIRDLFPSSPAQSGPWSGDAPNASALMQKFGASIVSGLTAIVPQIRDAIYAVVDIFNVLDTIEIPAALGPKFDSLVLLIEDVVVRFRDVAKRIGSWSVELAGKLAATIGAIGVNLTAFTEGMKTLATYTGGMVAGPLEDFTADLMLVVSRFDQMVDALGSKTIGQAMVMAEAIKAIVSPIKDGIESLKALAEYATTSGFAERTRQFVDDLLLLAAEMGRAFSAVTADMLAALANANPVANAMKDILVVVKPGIDAIAALAKYVAVEDLTAKVQSFAVDLLFVAMTLFDALKGASEDVTKIYQAAGLWSKAMADLLSIIKPGVDAIKALAEYVSVEDLQGKIVSFAQDLLTVVITLYSALRDATEEIIAAYQAAGDLSKAMSGILAVIKPGIDAIKALANYVTTSGIEASAIAFTQDILEVARALLLGFGAVLGLDELYASAAALSQKLSSLVGVFKPGIDAIKALADYTTTANIEASAIAFTQDILEVARALLLGFGAVLGLDELYEAVAAFSKHIGSLVGVLKPGIDGIKALAEYTTTANIEASAIAFTQDILEVARALLLGLGAVLGLDELYEAAAAFSKHIGSLVGVIAPGMAAIKALGEYVQSVNIEASVQAFAADLLVVAQALQEALSGVTDEMLAAYDAAVEFGKRIGAVVGVVSPGMAAIKALGEYVSVLNIGDAVRAFAADLLVVAEALKDALSGATDEMLAAYDAAAEFGLRIGAIFGNLKPALDMMMTLHTYGGNFMGAMTFLAQIKALIGHMAWTFRWLGTEIDDAIQFGGILQALVGILQDVMNGVAAMTSIELYQSAFNLAQNWMDGLIDGLSSRLDDLEALLEYIRGLFPSSPAKYGPFKTLPDGETVGAGFAGSMADGLLGGAGGLIDALGGLSGAFGMRGGGFGGLQPAMATAGGGSITVNINNPTVRNDRDIDAMAAAVSDVLARQAATNSRLGRM